MNAHAVAQMSTSRLVAAYFNDMRFEFTKMLRTPAFAVPTLVFPAMFYVLFGVLLSKNDPTNGISAFARLGVFGTMAPGLFGFGVSLAFEREYGLLRFKQALPMPPGSYLLARMAMALLFSCVISLLLITIAFTFAHAPLTAAQAATVFVIQVLGVLPFCAIGLCIGAYVSGQAAPALVNLIYLPMSFLSGLWVPLQFLPKVIRDVAPLWPSNHLAQLALGAVGLGSNTSTWTHIAALAGFTIVFFVIATRKLSNGGVRLFGNARKPGQGFPLGSLVAPVSIFLGVALIVVGFVGAKAPAKAAGQATPAAATASVEGPAGVPAPTDGHIASFDAGTAQARYGTGFVESADSVVGGTSSAAIRVVEDGAEGSKGALEITGTVRPGFIWPFAGAAFFPQSPPMKGMMDYSKFRTLSFFARGDGQKYLVTFFSTADQNSIPSSYPFETSGEWREVRVPLADFVADPRRIRGVTFMSGTPGESFRLQIDNVRFL